MAIEKLDDSRIQAELEKLDGWQIRDGKLHKELRFADFVNAFAFMTAAALVAESQQHHPEWQNVWNRVVIDLTTHDAGGISEYDFAFAAKVDELAARFERG